MLLSRMLWLRSPMWKARPPLQWVRPSHWMKRCRDLTNRRCHPRHRIHSRMAQCRIQQQHPANQLLRRKRGFETLVESHQRLQPLLYQLLLQWYIESMMDRIHCLNTLKHDSPLQQSHSAQQKTTHSPAFNHTYNPTTASCRSLPRVSCTFVSLDGPQRHRTLKSGREPKTVRMLSFQLKKSFRKPTFSLMGRLLLGARLRVRQRLSLSGSGRPRPSWLRTRTWKRNTLNFTRIRRSMMFCISFVCNLKANECAQQRRTNLGRHNHYWRRPSAASGQARLFSRDGQVG